MFTQNVVQSSVSCPEVIVGPFESGCEDLNER